MSASAADIPVAQRQTALRRRGVRIDTTNPDTTTPVAASSEMSESQIFRPLPAMLYLVTLPDKGCSSYLARVFEDRFDAIEHRAQGEVVVELRLQSTQTVIG
jgi:hypothetical protein